MQDYKYVWLAANSTFKADSDLAKYEKARKLKARPGLQDQVLRLRHIRCLTLSPSLQLGHRGPELSLQPRKPTAGSLFR